MTITFHEAEFIKMLCKLYIQSMQEVMKQPDPAASLVAVGSFLTGKDISEEEEKGAIELINEIEIGAQAIIDKIKSEYGI